MNTDYAELHAHFYYGLLDGTSSPNDLIRRAAAEMGMPSLALTDHDAVYGAVRFGSAAQQYKVHPVFGAEITLDGGYHLTLLVKNETGWRNLCWLITEGRRNAPKGESCLPFKALTDHTDGLIALSGCKRGEISTTLLRCDWRSAQDAAIRYCDLFGSANFWIDLQHHLNVGDDALVYKLVALPRQIGFGYVRPRRII